MIIILSLLTWEQKQLICQNLRLHGSTTVINSRWWMGSFVFQEYSVKTEYTGCPEHSPVGETWTMMNVGDNLGGDGLPQHRLDIMAKADLIIHG